MTLRHSVSKDLGQRRKLAKKDIKNRPAKKKKKRRTKETYILKDFGQRRYVKRGHCHAKMDIQNRFTKIKYKRDMQKRHMYHKTWGRGDIQKEVFVISQMTSEQKNFWDYTFIK